jgi:gentisate 1,2-dioxygenase
MEYTVKDAVRDAVTTGVKMIDQSGHRDTSSPIWPPVVVRKEQFDAESTRLGSLAQPQYGIRRALLVHPESTLNSFTPGIRVAIEVLNAGEETTPIAENGSSVSLCIAGRGQATINEEVVDFDTLDTWSTPNMAISKVINTGDERQVRLVFSDAPLLELLWARYVDDSYVPHRDDAYTRDPLADYVYNMPTGEGGIRTYQGLIDPEIVVQRPHIWRWQEVRSYLNAMRKEGLDQRASSIALLWNPATGRFNGTTNTLTAYMSGGQDPSWMPDRYRMARSHRHTVTAINYAIAGEWRTVVERHDIRWSPGDLVLTAPAWGIHANGSCDPEPYTFTVQDAALHAAMNTSLFQEYMSKSPILLGAQPGFRSGAEPEPNRVGA